MISKELAIALSGLDGGKSTRVFYVEDATGKGVGCYSNERRIDNGDIWFSYFKKPFKIYPMSNSDYWLMITGHKTI
jgi:hypothetical protein